MANFFNNLWLTVLGWLGTTGNIIVSWLANTGIRVIVALIVLLITFKLISKFARKIEKQGENGKLDKTLAKVFAYVFSIGLKCLVAICLVGYVGIDTSGLVALVTSLGVCVGLALNGALGNLAGGVLIIVTRPFKVDDFIEAQGFSGTVEDIRITATRVRTNDNKVVYIPNGILSSGTIVNYSEKDIRRVDLTFTVANTADVNKAKHVINALCEKHELVLKEQGVFVRISEHGKDGVKITARAWTNNADYWTVYFDIIEGVKAYFDREGIAIPHDQVDVHIKNN
jgi:small conductance mechanosensitive channel